MVEMNVAVRQREGQAQFSGASIQKVKALNFLKHYFDCWMLKKIIWFTIFRCKKIQLHKFSE